MNITAQIKRGVAALVLFAAIGAIAVTHAETSASKAAVVANVAPAHAEAASKTAISATNTHTTTRVHVGRPIMVSANPTPREIARASR